jgi:hypothetical protein
MPGPFGRVIVLLYLRSVTSSTPGTARAARKPNIRARSIGGRYGRRSRITPGGAGVFRFAAWSRSRVGAVSNTSSIVALNWRMLAKPAANAMSPMGSFVVSTKILAVCARCARASASGPAPSSVLSSRRTWRCS